LEETAGGSVLTFAVALETATAFFVLETKGFGDTNEL